MTLNNKVVVITGGNGYVGRTVARRMAEQGARVFVLVRRKLEEAQAMLDSLPNTQLQHQALLVDIKHSELLEQASQTVKQQAGRCDILINAAGVAFHRPIMELTEKQFDESIAVNLKGTWFATTAFYPLLKESGDGLVVNITSLASVKPRAPNLIYAIGKSGVNMMTQVFTSLGPEVRFVAIAPSMLPELTSGYPYVEKEQKHLDPQHIQDYINNTPIQRLCTADDIADVVESLATKIKFYNGRVMVLDGGGGVV